MTTHKLTKKDPRQLRMEQIFKEERSRLSQLFGVNLMQCELVIQNRKSRVLGEAYVNTAYPVHSRIFINSAYFSMWDGFSHQCTETVTHELCHVVARMKYGNNIRPHGREWKSVMTRAGKSPERVAQVTPIETGRKTRVVVVLCKCGREVRITTRCWNNRVRYTHACGSFLKDAKFLREDVR